MSLMDFSVGDTNQENKHWIGDTSIEISQIAKEKLDWKTKNPTKQNI